MKKIITFIITFAVTLSLSAQNWTKEMQKDFRKSKDVAVVVDLTQANIIGCKYDIFPVYFEGKYGKTREYAMIILDKITKCFKESYLEEHRLPYVDETSAKYVVHYVFDEISEKGGFNGTFYVMCGENKSSIGTFKMKEGRWNDFEALVTENIKKYFDKKGSGYAHDPKFATLYEYSGNNYQPDKSEVDGVYFIKSHKASEEEE